MKKIWINRARSFEEARGFEARYYRRLSAGRRLEIVQFLRESNRKFKRVKNENRKGLRRSIKVVQ